MKLTFASQTYGPIFPQAIRAQRAAIMHLANNVKDCTWYGDSSPDRQAFAAARNNIVQSVIHREDIEDEDGIFWCDDDVILPVDAITRLVLHRKDFVCGIYFQREKPFWPLIAHYDENGNSKNGKGCFNWWVKWPENVLAPIDGCGFGCVFTGIRMLREMNPPWFEYKRFSEDFDFCLKAQKLGYQLYVDTNVVCGHLADPAPVTFEHFKSAHPEYWGDTLTVQDNQIRRKDNGGTLRSAPETGNLGISGCGETVRGTGLPETEI